MGGVQYVWLPPLALERYIVNEENPENTEGTEVVKPEEPAVSGYDAFVGVDPEYRDANRNASLTQGELDTLHNAGLKTDAEQHRENQAGVVEDWNAANVVVVVVETDDDDEDETDDKSADNEDLSSTLL